MATPQLKVLSIVVADMAASIDFYTACGLTLSDGGPDQMHSEFAVGDLTIMLDTHDVIRSFDAGWQPPSGGHAMALAFLCDGPGEVDTTFSTLVAAGAGAHLEPFDAFWGQRYAVVTDPDGNHVDLYAPLQ